MQVANDNKKADTNELVVLADKILDKYKEPTVAHCPLITTGSCPIMLAALARLREKR